MTIIEQLEKVQGEMSALKASHDEAAAGITAKNVEIDGLKAQVAELLKAKDELAAVHVAAMADLQAKLDAEIKAHAESKKVIEDAERKLKDPAFAMASAPGDAVAVVDGGAASVEPAKSKAEQMMEIKDPKARRTFYLANEKEIKAGL